MDPISITNAGKKIQETNYWDSDVAKAGKLFFSPNAGCIRMLIPDNMHYIIPEIQTGKKIIISRGPWPAVDRSDAFEILFDDYSDEPFALHVGTEQWLMLPQKTSGWAFAAWTRTGCVMEKPKIYYRAVVSIPCLRPWRD
jgi:hypothetical protein